MTNPWFRFYVSVAITVRRLFRVAGLFAENLGHWFFNLAIYRDRAGIVDFGIDPAEADGVVVIRTVDANGQPHQLYISFYVPNRYLLTGRRRPSGLAHVDIQTQAMLRGWSPVRVEWYTTTARRIVRPFINTRAIDTCGALARRTARLGAFHDRLNRWFPSPAINSYHPADHSDVIVRRV